MKRAGLAIGGSGAILAVGLLVLIIGTALGLLLLLSLGVGSETAQSSSGPGIHCRPSDDDNDSDSEDTPAAPEAEIPDEYTDLVHDAAAEAELPPDVLAAQIYYESDWNSSATSHAGAEGIAQFMPDTWAEYGDGGDVRDPDDAIPAMGRYMSTLNDEVSEVANGEEHHIELTLAAYNAGPGAVLDNGDVPDYPETQGYVSNIMAASDGASGSYCAVPQGDIVEASMHMAWEDYRTTDSPVSPGEYESNPRHGEDESRDEYIEAAESIHDDINYAFFTDCGAFVSTAVRSSGIDPDFALRGTSQIQQYVSDSDDWETFQPTNEGELESGDVMIATYSGGAQAEAGHTYIYTGGRGDTDEEFDRAQGASLGTRPPAGHAVPLTAGPGETPYTAARYVGDTPQDSDSTDQEDE